MRLVCPNCDAEYEVDERVIPDAGRDVQCSNCGHAWFQNPDGVEEKVDEPTAPEAAEHADDESDSGEDASDEGTQSAIDAMISDDNNEAEGEAASEGEDETSDDEATDQADGDDDQPDGDDADADEHSETGPEEYDDEQFGDEDHSDDTYDDEDSETEDDDDGDGDGDETDPAPSTRELDEGVRNILRQEAEREAEARDNERGGVETQDELGLEDNATQPGGQAAQERMARLRGLDVDDTNTAGGSGARRDLLPDIEEINSSLTPIGSNELEDDFAEPEARKGGFSRGFVIMIVLATLIIFLYVYAPWISEKVPALASVMDSYVGLINGIRGWLDTLVQAALSKMT